MNDQIPALASVLRHKIRITVLHYQVFLDEDVITETAHDCHVKWIPAMSIRSQKVLDYVHHILSARHNGQSAGSNLTKHLR